jgi:hypothetical protein
MFELTNNDAGVSTLGPLAGPYTKRSHLLNVLATYLKQNTYQAALLRELGLTDPIDKDLAFPVRLLPMPGFWKRSQVSSTATASATAWSVLWRSSHAKCIHQS